MMSALPGRRKGRRPGRAVIATVLASVGILSCITAHKIILVRGTIVSPHDLEGRCELTLQRSSTKNVVGSHKVEPEFHTGFTIAATRRKYMVTVHCDGYEPYISDSVVTSQNETVVDLGAIELVRVDESSRAPN